MRRVSTFILACVIATIIFSPGTRAQVLPGSYSIAPNVSEGIQNLRSGLWPETLDSDRDSGWSERGHRA